MAYRNEGPFSIVTGEAIARNCLVKLSAGTLVYADAGDEPIGVTGEAAASGALATVYPLRGGMYPATAAAVIAINSAIYVANDGKVTTSAVGKQIGVAVEAATADGGIITCVLWPSAGVSDLKASAHDTIRFFEDWLSGSDEAGHKISETADKGDWLLTLVDGGTDGGDTCNVADDAAGGWLKIVTNDASADSMELQMNGESFKLAVGKKLWFNASFAILDVSETDFFIGLAITDTTVMTACTDRVGFELNNDGNIDALVEQNSTESTTDTTSDLADCAAEANLAAKSVAVGFYWDGVSSVYFTVDGVLKVTKTDNATTIVIPDDEALTPTICVKAASAAVQTAWIDYVEIIAER